MLIAEAYLCGFVPVQKSSLELSLYKRGMQLVLSSNSMSVYGVRDSIEGARHDTPGGVTIRPSLYAKIQRLLKH